MGNTDYLYTNPSFLNGMARSVDLFGTFTEYNMSKNGAGADAIALYNDAKMIGKDFHNSVSSIPQK